MLRPEQPFDNPATSSAGRHRADLFCVCVAGDDDVDALPGAEAAGMATPEPRTSFGFVNSRLRSSFEGVSSNFN